MIMHGSQETLVDDFLASSQATNKLMQGRKLGSYINEVIQLLEK